MNLQEDDLSFMTRRLPRRVSEAMKQDKGIVLAGGYIRSVIAREEVQDIDLFVNSKDAASALANKLVAGVVGSKRFYSENAITIHGLAKYPVQIIHRWVYDKPEDVVKSFDFTIASAAIWSNGVLGINQKWCSTCHENFYADLAGKKLVYLTPERNEDAGGSILRVLKFYQRGYRIPLYSLAAVVSRLIGGINQDAIDMRNEERRTFVLHGLLREVDPVIADSTTNAADLAGVHQAHHGVPEV